MCLSLASSATSAASCRPTLYSTGTRPISVHAGNLKIAGGSLLECTTDSRGSFSLCIDTQADSECQQKLVGPVTFWPPLHCFYYSHSRTDQFLQFICHLVVQLFTPVHCAPAAAGPPGRPPPFHCPMMISSSCVTSWCYSGLLSSDPFLE